MRTHDRPSETIPDSTSTELSIGTCDLAIDLLLQTVVACEHCECTANLDELARWTARRNDLKALPRQRDGE